MTDIAPGWYPDPADTTTQRYWDGEGWIGEALPADATPPEGPPATPPPAPAVPSGPDAEPAAGHDAGGHSAGSPDPSSPVAAGPNVGHPSDVGPNSVGPSGVGPGLDRPAYIPADWIKANPTMQLRPHGLTLASAGARLGARIIDTFMVFLLCVVANAWFGYQTWLAVEPTVTEYLRRLQNDDLTNPAPYPEPARDVQTLILMMLFVILAVWYAYEVPATANSGQTFGKRVMRIKVMRMESEERLGFGRSWRRWSRLGVPTLLWWCCGAGLILQALDCVSILTDKPLKQALHDKGAGTVVVRVPRSNPTPGPGARSGQATKSQDALVGGRDADSRKS